MDILLSVLAELATFLVFLGLASLAVYWALVRGLKPSLAVLTGALVIVVYVGGSFAADQLGAHPESLTTIQQTFDQIWQSKAKTLSEEKMTQAEIDGFHGLFQKYFLFCLPAWITAGALFASLLGYYLVSSVVSRLTTRIGPPLPLWQWIVPEPMIFGLIIGGAAKLFVPENSWMETVADNLLVFFLAVYTFAGLTITSFYFKKWRFPGIARILSYALLFELTFNAVFFVLGVLDIWVDFRKLKKPPVEPTV